MPAATWYPDTIGLPGERGVPACPAIEYVGACLECEAVQSSFHSHTKA